MPQFYKEPLRIAQKENYYLLENNNQTLTKTIEYTPITEKGQKIEKGIEWLVLRNSDDSIKITIQSNKFMDYRGYNSTYGCFPRFYWGGNSKIEFKTENNETISTTVTVSVYENLIQYLYCKY